MSALLYPPWASLGRTDGLPRADHQARGKLMNQIIYIVGLIVIVLFILGFLGLR
ncbi:hypothetical protein [Halovulum dunhuangense]|uniref:hypothetical protein n=1 Tax=Halovulum dunhuangense TaxID=1505036 RepID=UPI00148BC682|nr:hypothetical protein [Halovulum dunhuangense]